MNDLQDCAIPFNTFQQQESAKKVENLWTKLLQDFYVKTDRKVMANQPHNMVIDKLLV